jgi:hypothetical protein
MGFVKGERMGMRSKLRYSCVDGNHTHRPWATMPHKLARSKSAVLRACTLALRRTKREGRSK